MQKVEMYYDMFEAKRDMTKQINAGWRVHTCTMASYSSKERVLVVYEK